MLPKERQIQTKADLRRFLDIEMKQYGKKNRIFLPIRENDILARHALFLRKCEYHHNTSHRIRYIYYLMRLRLVQNKYALHIPLNTCDEGLKLMHVGPVLMNGNAVVGKCCSVHINTGLVAGGLNADAPQLGDGIVLGYGSVVVGNVRIADNVAVGANSVVTKDVLEENIAVAGVPAKKVSNNGRLNWNRK